MYNEKSQNLKIASLSVAFMLMLSALECNGMSLCNLLLSNKYGESLFEKESIEQEIQTSRLINQKGIRHPLIRPGNMDRLYSLAVRVKSILKQKAPDQQWTIVSLGQSAAWLVYCLKLLDDSQATTKNRYGHIAFSKHFFELNSDTNTLYRTSNPTDTQVAAYRDYLKKTGFFSRNPKRFLAIIEFSCYTRGLRSFDEVARSLLPKNMSYIITKPMIEQLMFNNAQILPSYTDPEEELLYDLRNSDAFNDRRVMNFPASAWENSNPFLFQPSNEVTILENYIGHFLAKNGYLVDSSSDSDDVV